MRRHLRSVTPRANAENQLPPPVAIPKAAIATAPPAFNQLDPPARPRACGEGPRRRHARAARMRLAAQPLRLRPDLGRLNLPLTVPSRPRLLPRPDGLLESARFPERQVKFHRMFFLFWFTKLLGVCLLWLSILPVVGKPS